MSPQAHLPSPSGPPPLVSVVIPAFRRAETVRRAVESVLSQTVADLEVIVVDDGSRDGTEQIITEIEDERVGLIVHETNRGGNAARQTGIDAARGTWVAFLDSDDIWLPLKLEKQLARLEEAGERYGFCYTWYDVALGDGSFLPSREVYVEGIHCPEVLTGHSVGTFSTMMVSRAVLEQVGGVDQSLPACQDWDLVIRINQVTGICVVPEPLVHYSHVENDPHRITTRKTSVVEGHRRIHTMLLEEYPSMDPHDVAVSQRYVMAALAQQGAVSEVVQTIRDLDRRTLGVRTAGNAGRMLLRAGRRRWQQKVSS